MSSTTIKVSRELRQRVQRHARQARVSQATVLEHALDLLDRESFFSQLRQDVVEHPEDAEDQRDREVWLAGPVATDSSDT